MIDPCGSQGEQLHHASYIQRNQAFDILKLRGGYNEHWMVFWITARFLTGAARFVKLGVPIWRQPIPASRGLRPKHQSECTPDGFYQDRSSARSAVRTTSSRIQAEPC